MLKVNTWSGDRKDEIRGGGCRDMEFTEWRCCCYAEATVRDVCCEKVYGIHCGTVCGIKCQTVCGAGVDCSSPADGANAVTGCTHPLPRFRKYDPCYFQCSGKR